MSSTLRTRVAAAVLLSPFAALLAGPALANHGDVVVVQPGVVVNGSYGQRHAQPYGYEGWRRDERAPRIADLTPEPGDLTGGRRNTVVSARFFDRASGVDPASVRLRINGYDVTSQARISEEGLRYREELRPGRYVAEVLVRDRAGNLARRSWEFQVAGRQDRYGYGYGYGRDGYGRDWRRD